MRIAYVGHDLLASCAATILDSGHTISHIYSTPWDRYAVPVRIADVARRAGVRVETRRFGGSDLLKLQREGIDLIVCAAYPYRLRVDPDGPPAVNVHPSMLPHGRGPMPIEWAILNGLSETGVSVHELTARFDAGPVLHQRALALSPAETAPGLAVRLQSLAGEVVRETLLDFDALWAARRAQAEGSYDRALTRRDHVVRWTEPVARIDRVARAFFPQRALASVAGRRVVVQEISCWPAAHRYRAGTVVARKGPARLVAAADGFVFAGRTTPLWRVHAARTLSRASSTLSPRRVLGER